MDKYVDIEMALDNDQFCNTAGSILFHAAHQVISQIKKEDPEAKVALDFPHLKATKKSGSLGDAIRVFGSEENITRIISHPQFRYNDTEGYINIGVIEDVPSEHKFVRMARFRGNDNFIKGVKGVKRGLNTKKPDLMYPFIKTESTSNKNKYSIRLKREVYEQAGDKQDYNSYGLCAGESTIPFF